MINKTPLIQASQWIFLTTIGLGAGIVTALVVGKPIGRIVGAMLVTAIVTSLVGAVLGSMQVVWLRRLPVRPIWWIAATTAGVGIGLAVGVVTIEQAGTLIAGHRPNVMQLSPPLRALSLLILGLVTGAAMGVSQWLVFRLPKWIATSSIGLGLAFAAGSVLVDTTVGGIGSPAGLITFVVLSGIFFGAATSRLLLKIRAAG